MDKTDNKWIALLVVAMLLAASIGLFTREIRIRGKTIALQAKQLQMLADDHRHDWNHWETPVNGGTDRGTIFWLQWRHCTSCNAVRVRTVVVEQDGQPQPNQKPGLP